MYYLVVSDDNLPTCVTTRCTGSLSQAIVLCPSLIFVFLGLPEALTVQSLPCHLHHCLDLWIHIQDTLLLAFFLLSLKHNRCKRSRGLICHIGNNHNMQ